MQEMDLEALARQEIASVLHIFEHWMEGDPALRALLEAHRRDTEAFVAAHRQVQKTIRVLEPHVSGEGQTCYAPYCAALAGSELAGQVVPNAAMTTFAGWPIMHVCCIGAPWKIQPETTLPTVRRRAPGCSRGERQSTEASGCAGSVLPCFRHYRRPP